MRYLKLMVIIMLSVVLVAQDADAARRKSGVRKHRQVSTSAGVNDARYADLILNPVTGEVYHQANADARRYPASLTKMMTLYMLFEALEQKRTSMGARLDISEYATTMPQTNLALSEGDSIPVETAIKALVVRSANDVAVVVAEALGGDVDRFADMMTAKARQLGMRNTVFQNPNGLPNSGQYTTARDMAKLGIALKRDFPQYYHYFNVRQFSWQGVTYYTHNRVMLRYPGTDGIKTGFIGASGFNLVSSVTRGGRPLVGVVLGGSSGAWRDNRMIALLDQSYDLIAKRGAVRGQVFASNLPGPKNGVGGNSGINSAQQIQVAANVAPDETAEVPEVAEEEDGSEAIQTAMAVINAPSAVSSPVTATTTTTSSKVVTAPTKPIQLTAAKPPQVVIVPKPANTPVAKPNVKVVSTTTSTTTVTPTSAPVTSPTTATSVTAPSLNPSAPAPTQLARPSAPTGGDWGIQVGAFSSHDLAEQAARQALQVAASQLQGSQISVIGPSSGATVHRARVQNISQIQAKKACEMLISNNSPCFIFKAGT